MCSSSYTILSKRKLVGHMIRQKAASYFIFIMKWGMTTYVGECKAHKSQAATSDFNKMETNKKQLYPLYHDLAANVVLCIVQIHSYENIVIAFKITISSNCLGKPMG